MLPLSANLEFSLRYEGDFNGEGDLSVSLLNGSINIPVYDSQEQLLQLQKESDQKKQDTLNKNRERLASLKKSYQQVSHTLSEEKKQELEKKIKDLEKNL